MADLVDDVSRPAAAASGGGLGRAPRARPRRHPAPRGWRRRRHRPVLAVRGADPARERGPRAPDGHGRRELRRGQQLLPADGRTTRPARAHTWSSAPARGRRPSVPIIASLNGMTTRRLGRLRAADPGGGRAARSSSTSSTSPPTSRSPDATWSSATRRSSRAVSGGGLDSGRDEARARSSARSARWRARLVTLRRRGLVLFNRFYQPDFDLERLEVAPTLQLSPPAEIRLPLLWIAILHGRLDASLAATHRRALARRGREVPARRRRRGDDHLGAPRRTARASRDAASRASRRGWSRASRRSRR